MKICTHCNADNPDSAKFCRSCGVQFDVESNSGSVDESKGAKSSEAPTLGDELDPKLEDDGERANRPSPAVNSSLDAFAGTAPAKDPTTPVTATPSPSADQAKMFFSWIVNSLKRPSVTYVKPVWWACVVIFGNAAVISLMVFVWASHVTRTIDSSLSSISSMLGSSYVPKTSSSLGFDLFLRGFFAVSVMLYVIVGIIFVGKKIYGDTISFVQLHDSYAQKLLPFALLNIVLLLLSAVGASEMSSLVFLVSLLVFLLVPSYFVATSINNRKLDAFWSWCIAMVVGLLILIFATMIFGNIAGNAFMNTLLRRM